jgi:hypothetical protein
MQPEDASANSNTCRDGTAVMFASLSLAERISRSQALSAP